MDILGFPGNGFIEIFFIAKLLTTFPLQQLIEEAD